MPYSNHALVYKPFASTVPFRVAELNVIFVAATVVTMGIDVWVDTGDGVGVSVGFGVGVVFEAERLPSSFETKTSLLPLKEVSYAPLVVGKLVDQVYPVTYTFPLVSRVRE